jgi:cytochrome c553
VTCFVLGAVSQRFYDAGRFGRPQTPQAVNEPGTDIAIPGAKAGVEAGAIQFDREPLWAYGFDTPPRPGDKAVPQAPPTRNLRPGEDPAEQTRLRRIEGSSATYSLVDIRDGRNVIDWFPGDHPPMPDIIAHGPPRLGNRTRGCGSCHLPNGMGRPENAPIAGLPVTYVIRQINDFRNGLRYTADPRKPNTNTMIELAKAMTDDELKTAAEYFASPGDAQRRVRAVDEARGGKPHRRGHGGDRRLRGVAPAPGDQHAARSPRLIVRLRS